MKTTGTTPASFLHTLRTQRRLPLFVLLVLVVQALAPALFAGAARAEPLTTVLCTAEGVRHILVVDAGAPAQAVAQHADCPYCGAHWQPPLLASSDALRVAPPSFDEALPSACPTPIDTQRVVAAHRSRAPPASR